MLVSFQDIQCSKIHSIDVFPACYCFKNKCYPKDSAKDALCKGRVRVQLKQSDNTFINERFQSSKSEMVFSIILCSATWVALEVSISIFVPFCVNAIFVIFHV